GVEPVSGAEPVTEPVASPGAAPLGPLTTEGGVLRIMAVGDSITASTCWRANLWQHLTQSFPGRFDLVGTLSSRADCVAGYDADNQGYGSALVTEIAAGITNARTCQPTCPALADLQQAFSAQPADVALMHFGTNDVWNSRPTEDIVSAYTAVVEALRAANPRVVVLVAQIIPMNVTETTCAGCTCAGCVTNVPALNTRIVSWAAEHSLADSPIRVVDQFSGYDAALDNGDGVHPNAQGAQKMADHWFAALEPLF
ncbi:MAG TPA: SGNH/GDSL hydrolase family protein, partial [Polyangiaceae bacterium]|nr:SGNH/GDSL hydrolase family protein [Polyangiaceae bacterium]